MKRTFRQIAAYAAVLTTFQLMATSTLAASQTVSPATRAQVAAPKVVSSKSTLTADELAQYQQKTAESRQAANGRAAGASGNKTALVVVGVAAVAGAIALASGGGGGGGGGY